MLISDPNNPCPRDRVGPSIVRRWLLGAVLPAAVMLSACATIVHGTHQELGIASEPYRAKVTIDGKPAGFTPVVARLLRRHTHVVRLALDGYQPFETTITRGGSWWGWGNLWLFPAAPIGLVVDLISGGLFNLTPDQLTAELAKTTSSGAEVSAGGIFIILTQSADSSWSRIGTLRRE